MANRIAANSKSAVDILRCEGNLNPNRMVEVKNRVSRLIHRKKHRYFLLDLKNARNIDIASISILMDRIQKVRSLKGDIKLFNLRPRVQQVLTQLGVGHFVETFSNEEEARRSFVAA